MAADVACYFALWRMGNLPPEDVPKVACDALERGLDSPALRYLASLQRPTSRDIGEAFADACSQVGIAPAPLGSVGEGQDDAWIWNATQIAKHVSAEILNGTLDPIEGWFRLPYREGNLGPLSLFFEFADRFGQISFDEKFRVQLIEAAKRFQSLS